MIYPVNSLPIVQVDYQTSRLLAVLRRKTYVEGSKPEKMSRESAAKYDKYWKEAGADPDTLTYHKEFTRRYLLQKIIHIPQDK